MSLEIGTLVTKPVTSNMKAQIEVIPCKVCGDKSSGVHYGVITCEGCKGFFRRSQGGPVNYQCPRNKCCVIDRVNRNRCQYCRLQKCIALGMSRDAVKFGRMSKKQREKVEDEVNLLKRGQLLSNGFDPAYVYSGHQGNHNNNNNQYMQFDSQYFTTTNGYAYPVQNAQDYLPMTESPTGVYINNNSNQNSNANNNTVALVKTVDYMDPDTLAKTITEAHVRTFLYSSEQVQSLNLQPISEEQLMTYKQMSNMQLWTEVAEKVTFEVQQIIEFAKMVPGFMDLSQDDQIMLLKAGSFELALIRLCRAYDASSNCVIFGNYYVPLEAFVALSDDELMLMESIFMFTKELQTYQLTDSDMALYSALALVSSDRPGLKDTLEIQKLHDKILVALKIEIGKNHPENEEILTCLIQQVVILRTLSMQHVSVLSRFRMLEPELEFPALHKELFSVEGSDSNSPTP